MTIYPFLSKNGLLIDKSTIELKRGGEEVRIFSFDQIEYLELKKTNSKDYQTSDWLGVLGNRFFPSSSNYPSALYSLSVRLKDGKSVHTFLKDVDVIRLREEIRKFNITLKKRK